MNTNEAHNRTEYIVFTQYLRPDGRRKLLEAPVTPEYKEKADRIGKHGWVFECEVLTTGEVSMTITSSEQDECIRVCKNGPEVHEALDRLIDDGITKLEKLQ